MRKECCSSISVTAKMLCQAMLACCTTIKNMVAKMLLLSTVSRLYSVAVDSILVAVCFICAHKTLVEIDNMSPVAVIKIFQLVVLSQSNSNFCGATYYDLVGLLFGCSCA
jgi:tellurite resistance protein TehA-like permease